MWYKFEVEGRRRRFFSGRRSAAAGSVALFASLVIAASASAAPSLGPLSVTADPVEGLPIAFGVPGTTPAGPNQGGRDEYSVWMTVRAAGGPPCAASAFLDDVQASRLSVFGEHWPAFGPFDFTVDYSPAASVGTELPAGAYLECAWIEDTSDLESLAAAQRTFSIREPRFKLSVRAPQHAVAAGIPQRLRAVAETYTVRVRYAEAPGRLLEVAIVPRRRCPTEVLKGTPYGFAGGGFAGDGHPVKVGGPFDYRTKIGVLRPGRFRVCAGIYDDASQGDEEASAQTWVTVRTPHRR
jgi:hypothetical protein